MLEMSWFGHRGTGPVVIPGILIGQRYTDEVLYCLFYGKWIRRTRRSKMTTPDQHSLMPLVITKTSAVHTQLVLASDSLYL